MKRKAGNPKGLQSNGHAKKRAVSDQDAQQHFRDGLFDTPTLHRFTDQYSKSEPFKHGVITDLLQPTLLRNVRDEIRSNISFTPKETDIYKIHQSGDLANLDGLEDASLKLLPSLVTLRDALYSAPFREYLSHITGSGPLSGSKTDMAVNVYTPTCHLLCHDDVIGSRRVSYILYLTDPDRPWKPEWGGALRLYPTTASKQPSPEWSHTIPPAFNQLSFFAVQPGKSFHDVEEVYARRNADGDADDGGRIRMAISGWYHIPQQGEDGYEEGAEERQAKKSSLAQLKSNDGHGYLPALTHWIKHNGPAHGTEDDETQLTEDDLNFLLGFMNPRYLTPETVDELCETFSDDSSLRLAMFFSPKFATPLREEIESFEARPSSGLNFSCSRPPHKHRYHYRGATANPGAQHSEPNSPHWQIHNTLLPSLAFRKWLVLVTGLTLSDCRILARRFRRGLDYTLATAYEEENPQLEVCVGITPTKGWGADDLEMDEDGDEGDGASSKDKTVDEHGANDNDGQNAGGYEVYMAGDDDDDDDDEDEPGDDKDHDKDHDHGVPVPSTHTGAGQRGKPARRKKADPAVYSGGDDGDDDGIMLSMPASWNTLSVVLRDRGTLRFVKYVSRSAPGDRWDVCGDWKVVDEDEEDEDEQEDEDEE